MKRQFILSFSAALLAAASAFAQGSSSLTVQVPFGFHVGNTLLPSGEYRVEADAGPGVVRLRSSDCKSAAMILSHPVSTRYNDGPAKLVFTKYGDQYFLSQVWGRGPGVGRELPTSRREREVAANSHRGIEAIRASK